MGSPLADLAKEYKERYGSEAQSTSELRQLYQRYTKEREDSLLDAAAATTSLNAILFSDQIDFDAITPQMENAFDLAYPNTDMHRRLEELSDLSPESREASGFIDNWRGKFFEVILRDSGNTGGQIGGLQLGIGQTIELQPDLNHPGTDLQIVNADGTVADELQAKATDSVNYIKHALRKNPDVKIVTTDEVAERIADDRVMASGINNETLRNQIHEPLDAILDTPLENAAEAFLSGLPVILITSTEGIKYLIGKQTFEQAFNRSLERGVKSGAAMSVGAILALVDAGVVSLPATFLTRIGIDRYQIYRTLDRKLRGDISLLQGLTTSSSMTEDSSKVA